MEVHPPRIVPHALTMDTETVLAHLRFVQQVPPVRWEVQHVIVWTQSAWK
jgi:hypothetical protein